VYDYLLAEGRIEGLGRAPTEADLQTALDSAVGSLRSELAGRPLTPTDTRPGRQLRIQLEECDQRGCDAQACLIWRDDRGRTRQTPLAGKRKLLGSLLKLADALNSDREHGTADSDLGWRDLAVGGDEVSVSRTTMFSHRWRKIRVAIEELDVAGVQLGRGHRRSPGDDLLYRLPPALAEDNPIIVPTPGNRARFGL
jgi:hypothetical protein